MAGDTVKSEFPLDTKTHSFISPEIRQEMEQVVRDMVTEIAQSALKSDCNITTSPSIEAERHALNSMIAALEAELSRTKKQVQDACLVINGFKSQLDAQAASYSAKVQQFEQKFKALSEQEAALKATNAQLRADREAAIEAERKLVLAKDQLIAHNLQLSSKLSSVQDGYTLKVAELNDSNYAYGQLQERFVQATGENQYWRDYYAASTSTSQSQPPPAVYFNVPQMPNRRNTVPDISPSLSRYMPFSQSEPGGPRGQKRPRVDSVSVSAPAPLPAPSASVNVAPPQTSPTSPEPFKLRPVRPANTPSVQGAAPSSTGSQPGPSRVCSTPGTSGTASTPAAAPHPAPSAAPAPVPTSPAVIKLESAQQQRAPQAAPSVSQPPSVTHSTKEATSGSALPPAYTKLILQQLFPASAEGKRECKLCKTRPDGVPRMASFDATECISHAEKYHNKVFELLKSRFS
ncbi:PTPS domain-containing protein [Ceratobasidium sp. AG-Ba]|nr:PTPS domain-containing protein [Ceratobasidium sp. AG-Ba]